MAHQTSSCPIKKLFIANRGEIAVRIIRACERLGVESVLGYSEADRDTLGVTMANESVCIGPASASESYLNKHTAIMAALSLGCDAIHPGYGFLAEQAEFRRLCDESGLIFVGPTADSIAALGDKLRAREIAKIAGVPVVPGWNEVSSVSDAVEFGKGAGYPFLLKASAGGGGRGMRVVATEEEVAAAFSGAAVEAEAAFGDPTLYIERYIERARHIEVQVLGDTHGKILHFGERDCSTQRRHQKLIEEAPSPVLDDEIRDRMYDCALRLASHMQYQSAGTVEFIIDMDTNEFFFLEMNTRIQVEHPVTEMVTGYDLVAEMIRVAAGEALNYSQGDIQLQGHSIECRINAEDYLHDFCPSPGKISVWNPPEVGAQIRLDTHCRQGYTVPPFYDSMIGKIIVHADDRREAIDAMYKALKSFDIQGIETTVPFHLLVMNHPDFVAGAVTTKWVESVLLPQIMKQDSET